MIHAVTDVELASRLSFFLWSSIPDDALLKLASEGSLKRPAVLDREIRRMLTDAKSAAIVENFAGQWLRLRNVRNILPNSDLYPDFDENLRQSFRRETEMFFESIIREDPECTGFVDGQTTRFSQRKTGAALWHCRHLR